MTARPVRRRLLPVFLGLFFISCVPGRAPQGPEAGCDLSAALTAAASPPASIRDFTLVRAGQRRTGVALIAPVRVAIQLTGIRGSFDFRCFAAPVYNVGDGVTLEILWEDRAGASLRLRRRFDAARRTGDRRWSELSAPLEIGGDGRIVLAASGGPRGDLVADWVAIADPRIVARTGVR